MADLRNPIPTTVVVTRLNSVLGEQHRQVVWDGNSQCWRSVDLRRCLPVVSVEGLARAHGALAANEQLSKL